MFVGLGMFLDPSLGKFFEFSIVQFFSKIFFEVFFEFGDGLELDHDFLVVASTLCRSSIAKMF